MVRAGKGKQKHAENPRIQRRSAEHEEYHGQLGIEFVTMPIAEVEALGVVQVVAPDEEAQQDNAAISGADDPEPCAASTCLEFPSEASPLHDQEDAEADERQPRKTRHIVGSVHCRWWPQNPTIDQRNERTANGRNGRDYSDDDERLSAKLLCIKHGR